MSDNERRQKELMLIAMLLPELHTFAVLSATDEHGQWFETLPDAIEGGRAIQEAGYSCNCGECPASIVPEKREVLVFRVDAPLTPTARNFLEQAEQPVRAWHGYAIAFQETMGSAGLLAAQSSRLVARIPAEKDGWVQYEDEHANA
jgi:hypothetical protein